MCTYPQFFPLCISSRHLPAIVVGKPFTYQHGIIHLLASVDHCSMHVHCDCSLPIMDYCPRPDSTTILDSECPEFSNLRKGRPKSGLGRCDRCEGLCRRNCTALGSSAAVWLYSMDILGKCSRLTIEKHTILTSQSQRNSSRMLHPARHGKSLKDQSMVSVLISV